MILICGYSRAGKTTYAERYDHVIHMDMIPGFSFAEKYKNTADYIRGKKDVVVEGVFHTQEGRIALLSACEDDEKICVWINIDLDTIALRATGGRSSDHKYVLPTGFEAPSIDEGWDKIMIIGGNREQSSDNKK